MRRCDKCLLMIVSFCLLSDYWQRKDFQYLTWFDRLTLSVTRMLNSHMLEINLKELTEAYMDSVARKGERNIFVFKPNTHPNHFGNNFVPCINKYEQNVKIFKKN